MHALIVFIAMVITLYIWVVIIGAVFKLADRLRRGEPPVLGGLHDRR